MGLGRNPTVIVVMAIRVVVMMTTSAMAAAVSVASAAARVNVGTKIVSRWLAIPVRMGKNG